MTSLPTALVAGAIAPSLRSRGHVAPHGRIGRTIIASVTMKRVRPGMLPALITRVGLATVVRGATRSWAQ